MNSVANSDNAPFWAEELDWLCAIEFLPPGSEECRQIGSVIVGYLFGYAQLTDTRILALVGDPDAHAYEILLSFSSLRNKQCFLNLVRANDQMGDEYVDELLVPQPEEIRRARPLAAVLPSDVIAHAALLATALIAGSYASG
jgi:hypothetical protein